MTTDPSLPLQASVYQALENANVINVFATVPAGTSLPWTVIGDDQIEASYEAAEMYECFVTIHVFGKKPQHKEQAALVMDALNNPLEIEGFGIVEYSFQDTRNIDEKDNQVGHCVLTFRYLIQPFE